MKLVRASRQTKMSKIRTTIVLYLALTCGALAQAPQTTQLCDGSQSNCPLSGGTNPLVVTGNSNVPTYSVSKSFSNSSAGDLFCVYGSSTKTVKVKGIRVTGISASGATAEISIVRRSTLNTGGGITSITAAPSDSTNAATTASALYFTTAPTPGTLVGNVRDRYINLPTTSGGTISEGLFQFTPYWDQPQVLRGASEGICVAATSTAGGQWAIDAEYSEQ